MKVIYVDTETTGLSPTKHDIIQIAGIIEIDGAVKEEFEFKCAPVNPDYSDPEALKIHGHSLETIKKWEDPLEVKQEFGRLLGKYVDKFDKTDKFTAVGYNVPFDLDMIKEWFAKCGDPYWGSYCNWYGMDVKALVLGMAFKGIIDLPDYKLVTVCEFLKIPLINAHDAMADIKATKALLERLLPCFHPINKKK